VLEKFEPRRPNPTRRPKTRAPCRSPTHSPAATSQLLAPSRRTLLLPLPCPRAGATSAAAPAPAAEAALLPGGLRAESLPRHVAVVMDGNSRWARARGLPSAAGHEAGRRALEEVVRLSRAWGVRALTAFAFSHENWSRPKVCFPPPGAVAFFVIVTDELDGSFCQFAGGSGILDGAV